jgi:streptogramin lyase
MRLRILSSVTSVLVLGLAGCHGGVSLLPSGAAPGQSAFSAGQAAHATGQTTIALQIPLPSKVAGLSITVFPQGRRAGPVAQLTANVSQTAPSTSHCTTVVSGASSIRTCTLSLAVPAGSAYDAVAATYNKFPFNGPAPGAKVLGRGVAEFAVSNAGGARVALTTNNLLKTTRVTLSESSIHALDPANFAATVTGLDAAGNAIVSDVYIAPNGKPATLRLSAPHSGPALAFVPGRILLPTSAVIVVDYDPDKSSNPFMRDGAQTNVQARTSITGGKFGTAPLSILPPAFTSSAALPEPTSFPQEIVVGPDGNLWFCEYNSGKIGRMTTSLRLTGEFGSFGRPESIVVGPDKALWITDNTGSGGIGRVTTSGIASTFPLPINTYPNGISVGPHNALWYGSVFDNLVSYVTTGGAYGPNYPLPAGTNYPVFSVMGPDGNEYFVLNGSGKVAQVSPAGAVLNMYVIPGKQPSPQNIIVGPDQNLWFTDSRQSKIFRLTTSGIFTAYHVPRGLNPSGPLAFGPDRRLWFAAGNAIGRLNQISTGVAGFVLPNFGAPAGIVLAPDGAFYITDVQNGKIVRMQ